MKLIGLTGRAGAGKDTVASIIQRRTAYSKIAFADPIKEGLREMFGLHFGLSAAVLNDRSLKEVPIAGLGRSPRELMQTLGTGWGRQMIDADLWIAHAQRRLEQYMRFSVGLIVTDVRFQNEAEWLRANGGTLWHVQKRVSNVIPITHASEAGVAIEPGDSVIMNDAGLEQLEDQVLRALAGELVVEPIQ